LERVAYKENLGSLNDNLKTRRLFFPKKPRRFLDAATFTQKQLMEMIEQEATDLGGDQIELWIPTLMVRQHFRAGRVCRHFPAGCRRI
jgi:hypothetical protein